MDILIIGFQKFKYPCVIRTDKEEYLYLLESYYQNVQVSGEKWHMSHLISCHIAWEIDSKLISVQLDHPVTQKPDNIVSRMHNKLN